MKVFLVQHLKSLTIPHVHQTSPPSLFVSKRSESKACHFQHGRDLHWSGADVPPWSLSRLGHNLLNMNELLYYKQTNFWQRGRST